MLKTFNINDLRQLFREKLSHIYVQPEIDSIYNLTIEYVLKYDRTEQLLKKSSVISPEKLMEINNILDELLKEKPIQYILGETDFFDLKFFVNKNTLIPRQETELLVDLIIKQNTSKTLSVLDIGTGSGCIAICLRKYLPDTKVTAIDISKEALSVGIENAKLNSVNISFKQHDILSDNKIPDKFDIIVSNPPYVKEDEKEKMHANVLNYEPHLALFVPDKDALKFYKAISSFAVEHLNTKGEVWVEINETLAKETSESFKNDGFKKLEIIKDLNGKDRFIKASGL